MRWAAPSALLGLPVTNAPLGLADNGLPVGVQIMAGEFADRRTLAFAALLEQLIGGYIAPPEPVA
jgi:amidase